MVKHTKNSKNVMKLNEPTLYNQKVCHTSIYNEGETHSCKYSSSLVIFLDNLATWIS